MADAAGIAVELAEQFFRLGLYGAAAGPVMVREGGGLAAGFRQEAAEERCAAEGFAGLSIQSVGHGSGSGGPEVHIYLAQGSLRRIKALPESVRGVPVRAHRMGAVSIRPDAASRSTNRGNIYLRDGRICCGSSCAPTSEASAGTLGALVRKAGHPGLFLLSNNHVLSGCNHVPFHQPILAPASLDGRADAIAPQEIGRHFELNELRSGDPQFVDTRSIDLALAMATSAARVSSWQGDATDGYDTPGTIGEPVSFTRVKKVGRTTGLTFGTVEARINTPMPITYKARNFQGLVWFEDIWTVRADDDAHFALSGDSGSLVVTEDGRSAVGILFAANRAGTYGWIIPMPAVVGAFGGLELVSRHGV